MDFELSRKKVVPEKSKVIKKAAFLFLKVILFLLVCFVVALVLEYHVQISSVLNSFHDKLSERFYDLPPLLQKFLFVIFVAFLLFMIFLGLVIGPS